MPNEIAGEAMCGTPYYNVQRILSLRHITLIQSVYGHCVRKWMSMAALRTSIITSLPYFPDECTRRLLRI